MFSFVGDACENISRDNRFLLAQVDLEVAKLSWRVSATTYVNSRCCQTLAKVLLQTQR